MNKGTEVLVLGKERMFVTGNMANDRLVVASSEDGIKSQYIIPLAWAEAIYDPARAKLGDVWVSEAGSRFVLIAEDTWVRFNARGWKDDGNRYINIHTNENLTYLAARPESAEK